MSDTKLAQNTPSESTPLLDTICDEVVQHNKVYERFSTSKKRFIVGLVSSIGLTPMLVFGTLVPSIPQIAEDLNSTGEIIGLAVSISIMMTAIEAPIWASYSTFYGRRPIYLLGLPFLALGSIGVGHAKSVTELLLWRIVQSFGTVGGVSIGAGVIGDIYKMEERGTAIGVFYSVTFFGPALAPLLGGFIAQCASWRVAQYALAAVAALIFTSILLFFPETIHSNERGLEKLNATLEKPQRFVFVNPFLSLTTLKGPTFCALVVMEVTLLLTQNILQVPLAYTIGKRYGIDNEFLVGACFIPWGIGSVAGAILAGIVSDRLSVMWRKRRNGVWVPEDRLRGAVIAAVAFEPLSLLASGFATQYVDGIPGLVLNLIAIFFNGLGQTLVLTPIAAYCVDVMHRRSADTLAAISAVRGALLGVAVAWIMPSIRKFGIIWTDAMGATCAWVGAILLCLVIRYGEQMRKWSNVEYSTLANN